MSCSACVVELPAACTAAYMADIKHHMEAVQFSTANHCSASLQQQQANHEG